MAVKIFCSHEKSFRGIPVVVAFWADVEFDPNKDRLNRQKHGVSLADARYMDFETSVVIPDERRAYGEDRRRAFGVIGGRLHVLAFTMRGETVRAISLRKANSIEVRRYGQGN